MVACLGLLAFIYSGLHNVGATDGHTKAVEWALRTTMENSVRYHASDIEVPDGLDLNSRELAEKAVGHYSVACATCHAAPGRAADPWMKIYPEAPDLTKRDSVDKWSNADLYRIIKHGIKDTGMLALGPTHEEEDIWAVTAFVRQLPDMTEAEYGGMLERYKTAKAEKAGMSEKAPHSAAREQQKSRR